MPRVPASVQGLIDFCNEHQPVWAIEPSKVGLTSGDLVDFQEQITATTAALSAQAAAKGVAKSSTLTANTEVGLLRKNAGTLVRTIVAYAEASDDPMSVFASAQIPPNAAPSPSLPPGQPNDISATLDDEGNITLKWKCVNPAGGNVVYSVMRRTDSTGTFTQVGVTGSRAFTDATIPAGSPSMQYQIKGFRGQTTGPASPIFTLQFGHGGGGGMKIKTAKNADGEGTLFKVAA